MKAAQFPSIDDMPIPPDIRPGPCWSASMIEMAEHIGAYETLLISQHFGGQQIYVAKDPDKNTFLEVIGPTKAEVMSWVYGGQDIIVPLANRALHRARRAPVIAAVHAKELTIGEAAIILRMRRDNLSRIINESSEGAGVPPLRLGRRKVDPRQIDMFADPAK